MEAHGDKGFDCDTVNDRPKNTAKHIFQVQRAKKEPPRVKAADTTAKPPQQVKLHHTTTPLQALSQMTCVNRIEDTGAVTGRSSRPTTQVGVGPKARKQADSNACQDD